MTSDMKGQGVKPLKLVHPTTPETDPYLLQVTVFMTVMMQHEEIPIPH